MGGDILVGGGTQPRAGPPACGSTPNPETLKTPTGSQAERGLRARVSEKEGKFCGV